MARTITAIPATKRRYTGQALDQPSIRKVAGYARVSTGHEDQVTSYEAQVDYYTRYITDHAGWQLAGIYTDEGITGTSTKHHAGFQAMVADALAGKIDLIITKSVSRFARNTVDSLTTVRQLKDAGVEVYFEKENIWTFDAKGELLITIMSSLAQEEARSISENVTWGHRKRFADGKVTVPFSRFLGYDRGEDGNLVINQEQAKLVRYIYTLYLDGGSLTGIARRLQAEGHLTASGNPNWSAPKCAASSPTRNTKATHCCKSPTSPTSSPRSRSRTKAKYPSTTSPATTSRSSPQPCGTSYKQNSPPRPQAAAPPPGSAPSPEKSGAPSAALGTGRKPGMPARNTRNVSGAATTNTQATPHAPPRTSVTSRSRPRSSTPSTPCSPAATRWMM